MGAPGLVRFCDLVGHDRPIHLLRSAFSSGRVAHAYLLAGPRGVGKFRAARAFAALLLCEKGADDACGGCQSCRKLALGHHPDLVQVERERDRKELRVDLIREMERKIALTPMGRSGIKVAVVRDAEEMNIQAQNCLLKTLEEPPASTIILLVAGNRAALPKTVLSRCQVVTFGPLAPEQVAKALVHHYGRDPRSARALAAFSDGSLGHALSLDEGFFTDGRVRLIEALRRLPAEGFAGVQALAEELKSMEDPESGLTVLLSWYRDAIRLSLLGEWAEVQNDDLAAAGRARPWQGSLRSLEDIYASFVALEANANKKLVLETLLIRLSQREERC